MTGDVGHFRPAFSVKKIPALTAAYVDLKQPEDAPIHLGERLWYVNINSIYEVLVNQNSEIISCTKVK